MLPEARAPRLIERIHDRLRPLVLDITQADIDEAERRSVAYGARHARNCPANIAARRLFVEGNPSVGGSFLIYRGWLWEARHRQLVHFTSTWDTGGTVTPTRIPLHRVWFFTSKWDQP